MAGIHQAKVLRDRETYEHMVAEEYGNESRIVIGKLSGKGGVESHISNIAMQTDRSTLIAVTKEAKRMADTMGRDVVDSDIEALVAAETGEHIRDKFELNHIHVESDTGNDQSWSKVRVEMTDFRVEEASGDRSINTAESDKGPVDAAILAINTATGFDGTMQWDEGSASDIGSDAAAGVFVTVKQGETGISVYAQAHTIDNAVIQAYLNGINMIERICERQHASEQNMDEI
jgi:D-citramalate synthase